MRTISSNGIALIKSFEGCHLTAYDDLQPKVKLTPTTKIKGTLTIGWGSTKNVFIGQTITQQQADDLLLRDLTTYIKAVNNKVNVPFVDELNQNQFDALVSFCYNAGSGNLKKLCNGGLSRVITYLPLYNKSKGIILAGLERRRKAELALFIKPIEKVVETVSETIIAAIQDKIKSLEKQAKLFEIHSKEIEAPIWITEKYPKVLDYITPNEEGKKVLPYDAWRSIAIALRYLKV